MQVIDMQNGKNAALIPEKVMALYQKLSEATDEKERRQLMIELAVTFADESDDTDLSISDDVVDMVHEVAHARIEFQRSALRLGRTLCGALEEKSGARTSS